MLAGVIVDAKRASFIAIARAAPVEFADRFADIPAMVRAEHWRKWLTAEQNELASILYDEFPLGTLTRPKPPSSSELDKRRKRLLRAAGFEPDDWVLAYLGGELSESKWRLRGIVRAVAKNAPVEPGELLWLAEALALLLGQGGRDMLLRRFAVQLELTRRGERVTKRRGALNQEIGAVLRVWELMHRQKLSMTAAASVIATSLGKV